MTNNKSPFHVIETSASIDADRPPALTANEQWLLRSYRVLNPEMQDLLLRFSENMTKRFGRHKKTSLSLIQGGAQ